MDQNQSDFNNHSSNQSTTNNQSLNSGMGQNNNSQAQYNSIPNSTSQYQDNNQNAPLFQNEQRIVNSSSVEKNNKLTVSLILGIVSLLCPFFINFILSIPISIVGLVLACTSRNQTGKKTASIILNIISIILSVMVLAYIIMGIGERKETYSSESVINDLNSFSNWNIYSELRTGNLGKQMDITGGWRILSDSETYWEFKNGKFWWYQSVNDLNDNYWYGDVQIVKGKKGLQMVGIDESAIDRIISQSSKEISEDDINTIIMTPTKIISGGVDKSNTNIPDNSVWKYVWIIVNHGSEGIEAQTFNVLNYDVSYYVKIKD